MTVERTRPAHAARVAALAIVLLAAVPARAAESDADAALVALNAAFRAHYAEARRATLARERTVVVVAFDRAILLRDGARVEEAFTPPIYERVKAVAHVPLALFVLSERWGDGKLPAEALDALGRYRDLVVAARTQLPALGLSSVDLVRQYAIIDATLAELDRTRSAGRFDPGTVAILCRSLEPLIADNVRQAARAQLDGLDAVVQRWRAQVGAEDWAAVRVVVLGIRQARVDNLQYSYFRRTLGPEAENQRLFYAEGLFTEQLGLDLLGTILLDRGIGIAFFGDPLRMERDLLGDAAAQALDDMFGKR